MGSMRLVLGIDLGTQGVRAVVADTSGRVVAHAKSQFARVTIPGLPPGYLEQDPADWWDTTRECLRNVVGQLRDQGRAAGEIVAGAVDSTSGTIVPLDGENRPLRSALMYNDRRAALETDVVNAASEDYCRKLGYRYNSSFALPKILWLARHDPEMWARTRHVAHAADYIVGKLTGVFDVSDQSNVLKTGFDLIDFAWPQFIEKELGIDTRQLPRVIRTGEAIARISKECSEETGLAGMSIVAGMTDGCADQIASGARAIGDWNTVLGTTLIFKGMTRNLLVDPQGRVYCHLHPMGHWMPGGASNAGARALDERFPNVDRREFDRLALALSPTALTVYPLLQKGERFPINQPDAVGFVEGEPTSDAESYAAHLEGIAFVERLGYQVLHSLGAQIGTRVYTTGGGAQSVEWMQIRADVLNVELARSAHPYAAMGSAIVAASRALFDNIEEASAQMAQLDCLVAPRQDLVPRYREAYRRFLASCRRRGWVEESGQDDEG
jgi:sugar (pentulose or hexulose) kinase